MKYFLAYIAFGFSVCLNAQTLPIDFESSTHEFSTFGGTQFSKVKDPLRPNSVVGKFANTSGSEWEGAFIDLSDGINLDSSSWVYFELYHPKNDSFKFQIKLEQSTLGDGDLYLERSFKTNTWHRDSFNFKKALEVGTDNVIAGKGIYKRVTIFFEGGRLVSGDYFMDNLRGFISSKSSGGGGSGNSGDTHFGKLVWSDEFDYNGGPKEENWHHQVMPPNGFSWFNGEIQHYTDKLDNSFVSDGSMKIVLKKESYTYDGITKDYTSARLNSKFAFTYGRVDVRAKLPSGSGVWPAIWTLGTNIGERGNYWGDKNSVGWPKCGEIDIMESWGHNPNYVSSAVHTEARSGSVETGGTRLADPYNDYHVYSLVWTEDRLNFYVDSVEIYEYKPDPLNNQNWPFYADQYILLNIAVLPSVASDFDSSIMEIDYVRVYQEGETNEVKKGSMGEIKLYPNPVRTSLKLEGISGNKNYRILNLHGMKMKEGRIKKPAESINVSELPAGNYVIQIEGNEFLSNLRFVKMD